MRRGFSLLEVMVVAAIVGISGSIAVVAMSGQIGSAKARSDEMGMFLRIKSERNKARERLLPLMIEPHETDGHQVIFSQPIVTGTTCKRGRVVDEATFPHAALSLVRPPPNAGNSPGSFSPITVTAPQACLDENGLPIGTFSLVITGSDGRSSGVSVNASGQFDGALAGKGDRVDQDKRTAVATLQPGSTVRPSRGEGVNGGTEPLANAPVPDPPVPGTP